MSTIDKLIENLNDVLVEADVEQPAGRGACYAIHYDENMLRKVWSHFLPEGFEWINREVIVSGEDFAYRAKVLCSFPKSNGKIRYIVEDNGRLFIQREAQITYVDQSPEHLKSLISNESVEVVEKEPHQTIGEALELKYKRDRKSEDDPLGR